MIRGPYIIIVFILLISYSCKKETLDRHKVVLETLEQKQDQYLEIQISECQEDFLEEINLEVDSIMFYLVEKMNGKNDIMPERPIRPGRLVDTISLEKKPQ